MTMHALTLFAGMAAAGLVSAVWQGVLLAVCVGLCLRLLPGLSAAARSVVWLATFVAALLLHFTPLLPAASVTPRQAFHADPRWSLALAAVWVLLSGIRAAQLLVSALHLRRIARSSTPVATPQGFDLPRGARLCTSSEVDRPSVAGFFVPRILIPPSLLASLSDQDLEQVLLHETEHLRRGDDWTNLLQKVALVVFPLNPVLLWVERRLCLERELACDDRVLDATAARKAYARCLAGLAEHAAIRRGLTLALGAWERQSELARRIYRILSRPQPVLSRSRTAAATGALLATLFCGSVALSHAPQLVSFVPVATPLQIETAAALPQSGHMVAAKAILPERRATGSPWMRTAARIVPAVAHPVRPRRKRQVTAIDDAAARSMTISYRAYASSATGQMILTVARMEQYEQRGRGDRVNADTAQPRPARQVSDSTPPAFVPVFAYAAVPTPNGWLIIQL
jgi:beta-lactamase regulating signal transducer with metallopeptidase domain